MILKMLKKVGFIDLIKELEIPVYLDEDIRAVLMKKQKLNFQESFHLSR